MRRKVADEEQSRIVKMLAADFEANKEQQEVSGDEIKENQPDEGCDDRLPQDMVGPKAVSNYYKHYKKLKNIVEKNKLNNTPSTS